MKPELFYKTLADQGIQLTDQQNNNFIATFNCWWNGNEKINLTAITEESDVYLETLLWFYRTNPSSHIQNEPIQLLDIELELDSSLPMKIIYPQIEVTIIDSL